jgi:DNA-nicking Smr family endonuclease
VNPLSDEKDRDDDAGLFREAMAGTRPLEIEPRVPAHRRRPAPVPRQRLRDEAAVLDELLAPPETHDELDVESGEEIHFLRDGYAPRLLRRLRRGHYAVHGHLDLHHMTRETAREALLHFIADATAENLGCVRVVHGKGLRSQSRPVLKQLTNSLLRRHKAVVAFTSCRPVDGGTGAVVVLLRKRAVGTDPAR